MELLKMVNKIDFTEMSYIFGIISIVMAFFSPLAGLIFGIIGLFKGRKQKSKLPKKLNIIGIVLSASVFILTFFLLVKSGTLPNLPI